MLFHEVEGNRKEPIMNAIVTAFAEQGLVLGAILLLAIYLQAKIHKESTALRKDMSDLKDDLRNDMSEMKDDLRKEMSSMKDDLRKEMSSLKDDLRKEMSSLKDGLRTDMSNMRDALRKEMSNMRDALRKEMSEMKDTLREDIGDLGQRVARLEGPLPRGASYDAVAEPSSDETRESE